MFLQQNDETKPPLVKKEEPDAVEPKQEKMETEEKKPVVKTEPKEEEDGGANGSSAASAAQNRKKGERTCGVSECRSASECIFMSSCPGMLTFRFALVFKPEELRQALMPTLEALYRQDPESLPFRQPVDPQLLCIPVSTTHGRTHADRAEKHRRSPSKRLPPIPLLPHRTTLTL